MRVVFTHWGVDIDHATKLVHSCKQQGYEVWQLTDEKSPEVPNVDEVKRAPMLDPGMLWRCRRLAELEPPYVSMDTDMLVVKDISDGFRDADVSLTWREKHMVIHKKTRVAIPMPYNGGLIFVNNRRFMQTCLTLMEAMPPDLQGWYGDQIALRDTARKFRVRELRDPAWNYTPADIRDKPADVRVFHFKGRLKKDLMPDFYRMYFQ